MMGDRIVILLLICVTIAAANPLDYMRQRAQLLEQEERLTLGGNLNLDDDEEEANDVLMTVKLKELDQAFTDPTKFLPSQNFLEVVSSIEQSEVFKIIQQMPKGAVLHVHHTAFASEDYLYNNITFRDNLYICDINNTLSFRFFNTPDNKCDWKLLSELRKNVSIVDDLNKRIRGQLSISTPDPNTAYPHINSVWKKFNSVYSSVKPMLEYKPVYEDQFYQGLQELYDDNVMYVEYRSGLTTLHDLNGTKYDPMDSVRICKEIADRFVREHPDFIGVKMIYGLRRSMSQTELENYVPTIINLKKAYPSFIAGFDLVGQEDDGKPLAYFAETLQKIPSNIRTFFHAGETNWYGFSSDQNLIDAILLNTSRIGHGYALLKHPKVLELVKARKIAIEINPISNQVLNLVKDLRNHPGNVLFAENVPIVISNDDPGTWGAKGLSYDFYEAFMGLMSRQADLRALKQLAYNSIQYSSMEEPQKSKAFVIWRRKWAIFIDELRNSNESSSSSDISSYIPSFYSPASSSEEDSSDIDVHFHWEILNGLFGFMCKININMCGAN